MLYLLYLFYARLTGEIEAFLYSLKGANAIMGTDASWRAVRFFVLHLLNPGRNRPPSNEHLWLVAGRFLVFFIFLAGALYLWLFSGSLLLVIVAAEAVASVLAFSHIRDKYYYLMRDHTDGTSNGFRYQSPTDSSEVNFNYVQRRNMYYISLGILAVQIILLITLVCLK